MSLRYHRPERMPKTATYVYCAVHRDRPPALRRMPPGVPGGGGPRLLRASPRFWLVVSDVPAGRYSAAAIDRRLHDLDWIAGIALAHEAVVERMGRVAGATVIPMKLFTMFSEPERAVAETRTRQRRLERIVQRIRGCEEWGVRVTRGAPARPARRRTGALRSGTAFLASRKQARDEAREQSSSGASAAAHALTVLSRIAKGAKQRPAPDGAAAPPLLDAAFLVPGAGARDSERPRRRRRGAAARRVPG